MEAPTLSLIKYYSQGKLQKRCYDEVEALTKSGQKHYQGERNFPMYRLWENGKYFSHRP